MLLPPKYPETLCSNTGSNFCNIFILSTYKGHLILASGNSLSAFWHLQRRWHRSDAALWPHPTAFAPVAWQIGVQCIQVLNCSSASSSWKCSFLDDIRKYTQIRSQRKSSTHLSVGWDLKDKWLPLESYTFVLERNWPHRIEQRMGCYTVFVWNLLAVNQKCHLWKWQANTTKICWNLDFGFNMNTGKSSPYWSRDKHLCLELTPLVFNLTLHRNFTIVHHLLCTALLIFHRFPTSHQVLGVG